MLRWKTGTHANLVKLFGRSLQRNVCFFNHLENSLTEVFIIDDGATSIPDDWTGPIGTKIKGDVHKLQLTDPQVLFNPHLLSIIDSVKEDMFQTLSTDHKVFMKLVRVAITGKDDFQWTRMKIGPIVHTRFTTMEIRIV